MTEKLISMNELSKLLSLSVSTITRLRKKGMPSMKIGGSIRFDPNKIRDWMESREEEKIEE